MPYAFIQAADGQLLKVLVSEDGVLQSTTNGADFDDMPSGAAATADAPSNAVDFLNDLTAAVDTITTLGVDGNSLTVSGLAGDTDGDYEFSGVLIMTGSGPANVVTMQPNGLATNQVGNIAYRNATGNSAGGAVSAVLNIGSPTNSVGTTKVYFTGFMTSKSGRDRVYRCRSTFINDDTDQIGYLTDGVWTGTGTAITSLVVAASGGMKAGSFIRVRRLHNLT